MSFDELDNDPPAELARIRARMSHQDRVRTFKEIYRREPNDEDELDMFIEEYTLELYNSQLDDCDPDFDPSL